MSHQELFLSQIELIENVVVYVARRHHLGPDETEEFRSIVRLRLVENDYEVLRKFRGKSRLRTYLITVIQRLFLDYRVRTWGKWRPSVQANRLGPLAVKLEALLVRDNLTFDEAVELLRTNYGEEASLKRLYELRLKLPRRSVRRFVGEEALAELATDASQAEVGVIELEQRPVLRRTEGALRRALDRLEARDRLILKMRFEDSFSITEIANALSLHQNQVNWRVHRILRRMRSVLEADGIQRHDVRNLLDHPGWEMALGPRRWGRVRAGACESGRRRDDRRRSHRDGRRRARRSVGPASRGGGGGPCPARDHRPSTGRSRRSPRTDAPRLSATWRRHRSSRAAGRTLR